MQHISPLQQTLKAHDGEGDGVQSRLVAYASAQAHSSAERAAMLGGVKVRLVVRGIIFLYSIWGNQMMCFLL